MAQAVAEGRVQTYTVTNANIFSLPDYLGQMLSGLPLAVTPRTVIVNGFPRGRVARSRLLRTIMSQTLRIGNWVFDTPAFIFCVSDRVVLDVWNDGVFRWNIINIGKKEKTK